MNANTNYLFRPYNPLEGLNARQIQRIFRIRANRKYLCSCCDEWSDTKLRAVPDSKKKICDECFEDNYFECFDCEEVQNLQDDDYYKMDHPDNKGKLVCICGDCRDNRRYKLEEELKEIGRQAYLADGMTEVPAVCYECGLEGKCLQAEGEEDEDWLCLDCSSCS
jgi:hypothetical protein